jgi:hypothetical protein
LPGFLCASFFAHEERIVVPRARGGCHGVFEFTNDGGDGGPT